VGAWPSPAAGGGIAPGARHGWGVAVGSRSTASAGPPASGRRRAPPWCGVVVMTAIVITDARASGATTTTAHRARQPRHSRWPASHQTHFTAAALPHGLSRRRRRRQRGAGPLPPHTHTLRCHSLQPRGRALVAQHQHHVDDAVMDQRGLRRVGGRLRPEPQPRHPCTPGRHGPVRTRMREPVMMTRSSAAAELSWAAELSRADSRAAACCHGWYGWTGGQASSARVARG
jgi:hypothetical protein